MKRFATAAAAVLIAASASAADIRGAWTAEQSDTAGKIQFNMTRRHSNNGQSMQTSAFSGLSETQIRAAAQTPVEFQLRREAGTVSFEGVFKQGLGAGQFSFAPNASYAASLRSLGVTGDRNKRGDGVIDDEDLFHLAIHDVSTTFIRSMQAAGYNVPLDQYMAMRIFHITPELIGEFRDLGFRGIDADELVASQVHKVTPQYVREMRAAGFEGLDLDELVSSRIHKVSPQFAQEMKALGYGGLDFDDLTAFQIHRVTPQFIRELRELGYDRVDADDLVAMRIHKVTPAFIRELRQAGYNKVPVEKLIQMRIHGIDAEFVKKMNG